MEVSASASSLNSNDVFLLRTQAEHYLWYGKVRGLLGVTTALATPSALSARQKYTQVQCPATQKAEHGNSYL